MMYKDIGIVLMVLLALSSCNKTNESIEVLARVENAFLTKKEVINRFPEYRKTDVESQVAQWVNAELLYAAGVRAGVNKDLAIVNRVEDYQKKLIGQTYLDMALRSRTGVSLDEIKDFYLEQKETFKRRHGEALINHFNAENKKEANKIRVVLEKGARNKKRNELFEKYGVNTISVEEGSLRPQINKEVFGRIGINYIGPIKSGDGYIVVEVIKRFPKGSYRSLDEVYDHIYLVFKKEKRRLNQLPF